MPVTRGWQRALDRADAAIADHKLAVAARVSCERHGSVPFEPDAIKRTARQRVLIASICACDLNEK